EFGHSYERECAFLTVHSMLHLLGYDHVNSDEEDRDMRARQRKIMKAIGLEVK
ncbi:MAG: rRNA maturation RNase YbeY, partial [Clostridia bacterium]|nr:rRNA maturation RNase YbeY [Clostridia bacterium]